MNNVNRTFTLRQSRNALWLVSQLGLALALAGLALLGTSSSRASTPAWVAGIIKVEPSGLGRLILSVEDNVPTELKVDKGLSFDQRDWSARHRRPARARNGFLENSETTLMRGSVALNMLKSQAASKSWVWKYPVGPDGPATGMQHHFGENPYRYVWILGGQPLQTQLAGIRAAKAEEIRQSKKRRAGRPRR